MTTYWCEHAQLPDKVHRGVRMTVTDGRFSSIETDTKARDEDVRLRGVALPGFANAHSHAFHRALRGRTHDEGGTFWTWRERMYGVAAQLDPSSYLALARATYAEMALAGVTAVVAHAGTVRAALARACGSVPAALAFQIAPLSLTRIIVAPGGWSVACVNRTVA